MQSKRWGVLAALAIVVLSAVLGCLTEWHAPGVDLYLRDWLMRLRGPLAVPDDLAIVAIDEPSVARFGRFPWPRTLSARAIATVASLEPKSIAVDILFSESTTEADDLALAHAIAAAKNVVVAAQLIERSESHARWLLPIPAIREVAAATGHVNVLTESDGIARQIILEASDDEGHAIRSMAVEAIRVGDGTPSESVFKLPRDLLVGSRMIPIEVTAPTQVIRSSGPVSILRAGRMAIDYVGPAGVFAPRTYSLADVVDGRAPRGAFRGKYVLIGATATSLGDRLASPFVHYADAGGSQHGALSPGVEVLANAMNTILRSRYYTEVPDWLTFLLATLVAAGTVALLGAAQGSHELTKQIAVLAGVSAGILATGYVAFSVWLIFPPITPAMVSFASAGLLGFLTRSLVASAQLDANISKLAQASGILAPASAPAQAAESIARLTESPGAAIFAPVGSQTYRLVAAYGAPVNARLNHNRAVSISGDPEEVTRFFSISSSQASSCELIKLPLLGAASFPGMLILAHTSPNHLSRNMLQVCAAIATSSIAQRQEDPPAQKLWPRGLEWKVRAIGHLNGRVLERAQFVDRALQSVEDGLLIASADGRITFANRQAARILGSPENALIGRALLERLSGEQPPLASEKTNIDSLVRLLIDHASIERDVVIGKRHYICRLAGVSADPEHPDPVLGIVASLSEVTREYELQQTQNDVVTLVSHEMRTPLTAIQGMTELLANYRIEPERARVMNIAINDEVKRLARMISEYLDITNLERGSTPLRLVSVRLDTLIERALLLLDPLAAERRIRLIRQFGDNLAPVLADSDLLSRMINNLVSNAIKYSSPDTEVTVVAKSDVNNVYIEVTDQGYGIPEVDTDRVFEKFYRIPRAQDVDVPGTGLGLALVREIAELHGGSVRLRSSPGSGSTFTVTIPRSEDVR